MIQNGSSPENESEDPFAQVARQIAEILSATGVTSCQMTLTMNDPAGAALTSTLAIDLEAMDEDRAPDGSRLDGVFVLFSVEDPRQ